MQVVWMTENDSTLLTAIRSKWKHTMNVVNLELAMCYVAMTHFATPTWNRAHRVKANIQP